ncbi:MAG: c-type cytochrome [Saprospiraceae bacterium]|nr:c-type cytochrome [Saprospiraceae bacterium]
MKKALKYLGITLGGIILILLCLALFVSIKGIPTYEPQVPEVSIQSDSMSIANGKRLVTMICAGCHLNENRQLAGGYLEDIPTAFGKVWSQNITRHETEGLGRYSDGQLMYLLRTGVKKDGNFCPPWMPSFPLMGDEDLEDIIAFLRSDDPMTAPSDKAQPAPQPSFLVKALSYVAFKPLPYPEKEIVAPPPSDQLAYGKYLMNGLIGCYECHSADFKSNVALTPESSVGYYGGGNPLIGPDGEIVPSANLTPHESGLKGWTRDQFEAAVRSGKKPDGGTLNPAMPPHPMLTDEEIDAMWAFIQTVPPIDHVVDRYTPE